MHTMNTEKIEVLRKDTATALDAFKKYGATVEAVEPGVKDIFALSTVQFTISYEHPASLFYIGKYVGEFARDYTQHELAELQNKFEYENDL
jgi:hypothetical protein